MVVVRDLVKLLNQLPEDMPIYWVVDGKVPVVGGAIQDVPLWVLLVSSGKLYMPQLGMHYPTYLNQDDDRGSSLYDYVQKLPKKSRWERIKSCVARWLYDRIASGA